jgi:hypothetical protein
MAPSTDTFADGAENALGPNDLVGGASERVVHARHLGTLGMA